MDMHDDNRLELIEHYKKQLVESTNIKSSPDEMAVIDSILFRFWQMGWLKEQEAVKPKLVGENMWRCGKCGELLGWEDFTPSGLEFVEYKFCPECGKMVKWE